MNTFCIWWTSNVFVIAITVYQANFAASFHYITMRLKFLVYFISLESCLANCQGQSSAPKDRQWVQTYKGVPIMLKVADTSKIFCIRCKINCCWMHGCWKKGGKQLVGLLPSRRCHCCFQLSWWGKQLERTERGNREANGHSAVAWWHLRWMKCRRLAFIISSCSRSK
jgi:hypothetical protein